MNENKLVWVLIALIFIFNVATVIYYFPFTSPEKEFVKSVSPSVQVDKDTYFQIIEVADNDCKITYVDKKVTDISCWHSSF